MIIGFIYKIYDNTNGNVYYGSTKETISRRMAGHRNKYKSWVDGKTGCCKSFDIIKNEDYAYSLVEQVEYENRMELLQRERWYIENNECVNKNVPARTLKESHKVYDEANKDKKKAFYTANKERLKEQTKAYREANIEQIRENDRIRNKAYREANREKIRENDRIRNKAYREANIEQIRENDRIRNKAYREANIEKIRERDRTTYAKKKAKINELNV